MKYFITEIKYKANELLEKIDDAYLLSYKDLKLNGFIVVNNFLDEAKINALKNEMDQKLKENIVWKDEKEADLRIYGIDQISENFKDVFKTPMLKSIYNKYIDSKTCNEFIMANKIEYKDNNLGSGGGWHRDSLNRRQLKFILYLSDADVNNGCFQYLKQTQSPIQKMKINKLLNKGTQAYRYTDNDIEILLKNGYELVDFAAKAGTLLIVETSGIHRGRPLEKGGCRYALTNYMSETPFASQIVNLLPTKL